MVACGGGDGRPLTRRGPPLLEAEYYDDEPEAERWEARQRRSLRTHGGSVERHGTLTLLWLGGRESRFAERTRACLL